MESETPKTDSKATILLVDDDSINLSVFGQCLMVHYAVLVATSGTRALEIVQGALKPDLILLDVMMPGMDGYEVMAQLKANPATRDIPVIFVTALTSDQDEERGLALGAVDYIYKPCHLSILLARVRTHIELKKARDRLTDQNLYLEAEVERRHLENQRMHLQLLQSEKLAAIGQLAAGVAHEINNPLGFVYSNLSSLNNYFQDLFVLLGACERLLGQHPVAPDALQKMRELKQQVDLDFLRQDIPDLIAESKQGLSRVRDIIQNLNKYAQVDSADWQLVDLHECLDSTLNIFYNESNKHCTVRKEYGTLPEIACLPSQLNQVFMSLLMNAAQAIETEGNIIIRTGCNDSRVWVDIADNGQGIAPEHLTRLFEPFFTTRAVGQGIGLGLSAAESIVRSHHGNIEVSSKLGEGSTFRVWLPISQN
ncbi:response regulator [Methylomonas sp. LL1]|uniref:response regulator n=1 Tax=Methylomonas sp. LL1 TaxID=2785785 RepID=UPI0018C385F6|nr:response regulator [Methylomonas sp. LL1]QPK63901.1 response regulator [Methylomonas sp. LL1]